MGVFFKLYLNMTMVWTTKTYFVFPYVSIMLCSRGWMMDHLIVPSCALFWWGDVIFHHFLFLYVKKKMLP